MKHVFTFLAFVLMSSGFAQESEVPPNPYSSQTAAGVFGGDEHIWLTDAEFLNFGQSSFTAHVRFRSTDLSNLNECCGYQTLIAKGASGGTGNKGFNLDLRGEPDNARINCNFISSAGNNLYLVAPIEESVWYDLVYVVDWSNELATLFVNGIVADEGSIAGLGSMDNDWYAAIGRYVWNNDDGNDAHFLRGEMSWLRMIEGADYELGLDPCSERENPLFELDEFTAEEVATQVNTVFSLDEVVSIESPCETIVQVLGCTDPAACNFMPAATQDDGSCIACSVFEERCGQGTLWDEDSQTCIVAHPSDTDFDGCVGMTDLLDLLSVFGTCVEVPWTCGDPLEYQGYDYETVQIGGQCWFAENLRSENYANGDAIPSNLSDSEWANTSSGALSVYGEGNSNCEPFSPDGDACDESWSLNEYGRLYTWPAVDDDRDLCPSGWHVPTDENWMTMEMALGMNSAEASNTGWRGTDQGTQMKTDYGWSGGGNGTNSSGFSGLPGGVRKGAGNFNFAGNYGYWWSSSPFDSGAWTRELGIAQEFVKRTVDVKNEGHSVRCVRDSE